MKRCYFINDPEVGRVLIPGCYSSLHRNDLECCTCPPRNKKTLEDQIEALKKRVSKLEKTIAALPYTEDK